MGLIFHTVKRKELQPGDHIYTWRKLYLYAHHGIYVGDGMVIHYGIDGRPPPECERCIKYRHEKSLIGSDNGKGRVYGLWASCLDCFLVRGTLKRFEYSVPSYKFRMSQPMTCSTAASDPPEMVIERAISILRQGFGYYNLIANNCEDFAYFCKTGNKSPPVRSSIRRPGVFVYGALAIGFAALAYVLEGPSTDQKQKSDEELEKSYYATQA